MAQQSNSPLGLSSSAMEWLTILRSLPDPSPYSSAQGTTLGDVLASDPALASVVTLGVLSQAAVICAIQTLIFERRPEARERAGARLKRPRRLTLNLGKGGTRLRIELDDAGAGDDGDGDAGSGDAGDGSVDSGEATAGTTVDVDPPDSDDGDVTFQGVAQVMGQVASDVASTIGDGINAAGSWLDEGGLGELADEAYNALMEGE